MPTDKKSGYERLPGNLLAKTEHYITQSQWISFFVSGHLHLLVPGARQVKRNLGACSSELQRAAEQTHTAPQSGRLVTEVNAERGFLVDRSMTPVPAGIPTIMSDLVYNWVRTRVRANS